MDQEKIVGAKSRNGSAFERCEKALKRRSYDLGCENDAKRNSSFCDWEKGEKSSEDAPRLSRVQIWLES